MYLIIHSLHINQLWNFKNPLLNERSNLMNVNFVINFGQSPVV